MKRCISLSANRGEQFSVFDLYIASTFVLLAVLVLHILGSVSVVHADNFTDLFYTNSFRGSFEWFSKLDFIGMIVQAVISIFSLVGVSLIVIRVMTSLLYLSARGLWEEVHDLKQSGGESEMYDFGFLAMAKGWAKGKGGFTGLDAILGAVLTLLPDVKRYSDFGEKSGQKFDEDVSISQYMLKIALPVIMAVFFFAMGFNGTLVKGLAVTVDAMGTLADKAVSVNYAGFVEDLVNSRGGYKFTFDMDGTDKGALEQDIAVAAYGRVVSEVRGANEVQLSKIGVNLQNVISQQFDGAWDSSPQITDEVKNGVSNENGDRFYGYVGYDIRVTAGEATGEGAQSGAITFKLSELLSGVEGMDALGENSERYYYINLVQTKQFDGAYYNIDEIVR